MLITNKLDEFLIHCKGKKVLDVGCVGQARSYRKEDWIHGQIKAVAECIHGVDIDKIGVEELSGLGYDVFLAQNLDPTMKYDVIIMSDVIEHVNDPVDFLRFYKPFLSQDGKMLITTPNANRVKDSLTILVSNEYGMNAEHTMWFCEKTFQETCRRSGLQLTSVKYIRASLPEDVRLKKKLLLLLKNSLIKFRPKLCDTLLFEVKLGNV